MTTAASRPLGRVWVARGLLVVLVASLALIASISGASAAKQRFPKCTSYIKYIRPLALTGLPASVKVTRLNPGTSDAYFKGPWWDCSYLDANPPWASVFGKPYPVGAFQVSYRSSTSKFAAFEAGTSEGDESALGPDGSDVTYSSTQVKNAKRAFVCTDDWADYYSAQVSPTQYPHWPQYVYELYALTKNDNIVYMYFFNQDLSAEKSLLSSILARYKHL